MNPYLNINSCAERVQSALRENKNPIFLESLEQTDATSDDLMHWGMTEGADIFMWIAVGPSDHWKTLAVEAGVLDAVLLPQSRFFRTARNDLRSWWPVGVV